MLAYEKINGSIWQNQVGEIIQTLPENVYISFDIDGLDPSLCVQILELRFLVDCNLMKWRSFYLIR